MPCRKTHRKDVRDFFIRGAVKLIAAAAAAVLHVLYSVSVFVVHMCVIPRVVFCTGWEAPAEELGFSGTTLCTACM